MTHLREWMRRCWGALRQTPSDRDLERELRFHLEQAEARLIDDGLSPAEAARRARVQHGHPVQVMESLRDQRGLPAATDLVRSTTAHRTTEPRLGNIRHSLPGAPRKFPSSISIALGGSGKPVVMATQWTLALARSLFSFLVSGRKRCVANSTNCSSS